jgi:hypothetical protein
MIDCRFAYKDFNMSKIDDLLILKDMEIISISLEKYKNIMKNVAGFFRSDIFCFNCNNINS